MSKTTSSLRCMILAVTLAVGAFSPVVSGAQASAESPPLVTIRFNQARVYFDQQLYGAISKAVAVKPEVTFEVVSYAPSTGSAEADKQWQAVAGRNTRSVISAMNEMGVPMSRINVIGQSQSGLRFDETRVYVR